MLKFEKVIFVSLSDTCRGPLAATIMKSLIDGSVTIDSKGIVVLFPEPVNPKAVAIARSKGLYLDDHTAEALVEEDFDDHTLVLVMAEQQKKKIYDDFATAVNVYTIREFVGEAGDVEAPYGKELPDYGVVCEELERLVEKVRDKINN